MNPILTKSFLAQAIILRCTLAKVGTSDDSCIPATDGSAPFLGATVDSVDSAVNDQADIIRLGIAYVKLGGTVARGELVTSDANGAAVAVVVTPGTAIYYAGIADHSGVIGDVIPVFMFPGCIANDTGVATVDITLTSAQLKALHAAPISLVAAPGAGKFIQLVDVQAHYIFGTVDYVVGGSDDLAIRYTDGAGVQAAVLETTGFLDQGADQYRYCLPLADAAKTPAINAALVANSLSGELTTGDGTLKLRIRYRTQTAAF